MTGTSAFQDTGAELDERLSSTWLGRQEQPRRPQKRAGHLDELPSERATAEGRPEED